MIPSLPFFDNEKPKAAVQINASGTFKTWLTKSVHRRTFILSFRRTLYGFQARSETSHKLMSVNRKDCANIGTISLSREVKRPYLKHGVIGYKQNFNR